MNYQHPSQLPLLLPTRPIIIVQGEDKSQVQEEEDKKIQEEGMIRQSPVTLVAIYQISTTIIMGEKEVHPPGVVITLV